jgi:hypothetical protein
VGAERDCNTRSRPEQSASTNPCNSAHWKSQKDETYQKNKGENDFGHRKTIANPYLSNDPDEGVALVGHGWRALMDAGGKK